MNITNKRYLPGAWYYCYPREQEGSGPCYTQACFSQLQELFANMERGKGKDKGKSGRADNLSE